jgi:hypothetical protein
MEKDDGLKNEGIPCDSRYGSVYQYQSLSAFPRCLQAFLLPAVNMLDLDTQSLQQQRSSSF